MEWVYGIHTIQAVLRTDPKRVSELYIAEERHDQRIQQLLSLAYAANIKVQPVTVSHLNQLCKGVSHQGVVAKCHPLPPYPEAMLEPLITNLSEPAFLLLLDGVQDPHNLGACLRTANALGVQAVIVPKDRASGLTPVARKTACGAAEVTPLIQVTNLTRSMRLLKEMGIWIYGMTYPAPQSLYSAALTGPLALVLGAEGQGIRRLTREHCDNLFYIPMQGSVESFNVSVAAGICLAEAYRQRHP